MSGLELKPEVIEAIEHESKKIQIPYIEVRAVLEIVVKKGNGIDIIKSILVSVEGSKNNSKIDITYVGAPKYRITVTAENFKIAEKVLNQAIEKIKSHIVKNGGTFKFFREESKKNSPQHIKNNKEMKHRIRKCKICQKYTLKESCPFVKQRQMIDIHLNFR